MVGELQKAEQKGFNFTQKNMIAKYIMDCLSRQKMIVFSWGFHKAIAIKDGLQFNVNGFIHKGIVEIIYNEGTDYFNIKLIKNSDTKSYTSNVAVSELIEVLDCLIEKVQDYDERVKKEYFFHIK